MGRVGKYCSNEFSKDSFLLRHDSVSDFYLSCFQRNQSPIPLLIVRIIIFVGCTGTLVASMVIMTQAISVGMWFIFLTHWGLILNVLNSIFALVISMKAACQGSIEYCVLLLDLYPAVYLPAVYLPAVELLNSFSQCWETLAYCFHTGQTSWFDEGPSLPWYVKTYWVFYNMSIPLAFFITIFYFALLTDLSDTYGMNEVLDMFVHLVNSLLMLVLVVCSRHPTRLLHFYWTLSFGLIYMIFTVIFHFSAAKSPFGTDWIYPMVDWSKPGQTIGVVIGSAAGLVVIHFLVVAITLLRDWFTRSCKSSNFMNVY